MTCPDVTVSFSEEKLLYLDASQWKLYRDVMLKSYQHLLAVGESFPWGISPSNVVQADHMQSKGLAHSAIAVDVTHILLMIS